MEFQDGKTVPSDIDLGYENQNQVITLRNNSTNILAVDSYGVLDFESYPMVNSINKITKYTQLTTKKYVDSHLVGVSNIPEQKQGMSPASVWNLLITLFLFLAIAKRLLKQMNNDIFLSNNGRIAHWIPFHW